MKRLLTQKMLGLQAVVEASVYPQVAAGFADGNAYLRELTLKSMLVLAPKLSQQTLNQSLLKHLAKLQVFCLICRVSTICSCVKSDRFGRRVCSDRQPSSRCSLCCLADYPPKQRQRIHHCWYRIVFLIRFLAAKVDEEAPIRANTTILLGNLAAHLSDATCKRVLLNAFTRALKDSFPPARIAGLKARLLFPFWPAKVCC